MRLGRLGADYMEVRLGEPHATRARIVLIRHTE